MPFSSNVRRSKRHSTHWTQEFVNLLLNNRVDLSILPEAVPKSPVCFRSVLISPNKFNSPNKIHDLLFRNAGIDRKLEAKKGDCRPNIVMIVRDSSKRIDRTIPQEIINAFLKEMPFIEVIRDLGKLPLIRQIQIMQRSNICVHAAEISNVVFVRERTRMIELFPFGYYTSYFNLMYEAFNVRNVRRITSKPDIERFTGCMNHLASKKGLNQEIKERILK